MDFVIIGRGVLLCFGRAMELMLVLAQFNLVMSLVIGGSVGDGSGAAGHGIAAGNDQGMKMMRRGAWSRRRGGGKIGSTYTSDLLQNLGFYSGQILSFYEA